MVVIFGSDHSGCLVGQLSYTNNKMMEWNDCNMEELDKGYNIIPETEKW